MTLSIDQIIENDTELARKAMNTIWNICQKLHKRHISLFDAVDECGVAYDHYQLAMLKPIGTELTKPNV